MKKKFISIIWWYHKQIFSFDKKQNYHMLPIEAMQEEWFECEIFAIDSKVKIEEDSNFVKWTRVIYYKWFLNYLIYLFKNRNAIIYSNSLTIKTLLVWIIWKKTVFMPHDSIFWSNFIKKLIIIFFYFFYKKIRVNNDREVFELNRIKKWLALKVPLIVSEEFYNKDINFSNENIFISLWNLIPKKQPEFLLQALKIVKDNGYNFKLKVIWEDRLENHYNYSYSDLINKYWLSENIEVLGFIKHDDIPKKVEWSSLYINTSTQEWFCLAVYESALMWLWIILPRIISFDNIFWNNALYYDLESVNDLANKIMYFINNKNAFIAKNKENQKMILEKYNYDYIKSEIKKIFINL